MASCLIPPPVSTVVAKPIEIDVTGLVSGTGQWENMQGVLRSAVKALLDHQGTQQAQLKQLQQWAEVFRQQVPDKAAREDVKRVSVGLKEVQAEISKLKADLAVIKEETKSETRDLWVRLESKPSKDHISACLDAKANKAELIDIRSSLGRLNSGAGLSELRGRQTVQDRSLMLEKRVSDLEGRVRGCEALCTRADPGETNRRLDTVGLGLMEVADRLDSKADAAATEAALVGKASQDAVTTALTLKADRKELSAIEASAASLLALSREHADASRHHEGRTRSQESATAALGARVDHLEAASDRLQEECSAKATAAVSAALGLVSEETNLHEQKEVEMQEGVQD
ncbi:unnamed protein product, partial [Discosporangium mesarthrocarpum]